MTIAQLAQIIAAHNRDEAGQALTEYAFILVLVFVAAIATLIILGGAVMDPLTQFVEGISGIGS
jgi:Flp pilus assembly pilin Flp